MNKKEKKKLLIFGGIFLLLLMSSYEKEGKKEGLTLWKYDDLKRFKGVCDTVDGSIWRQNICQSGDPCYCFEVSGELGYCDDQGYIVHVEDCNTGSSTDMCDVFKCENRCLPGNAVSQTNGWCTSGYTYHCNYNTQTNCANGCDPQTGKCIIPCSTDLDCPGLDNFCHTNTCMNGRDILLYNSGYYEKIGDIEYVYSYEHHPDGFCVETVEDEIFQCNTGYTYKKERWSKYGDGTEQYDEYYYCYITSAMVAQSAQDCPSEHKCKEGLCQPMDVCSADHEWCSEDGTKVWTCNSDGTNKSVTQVCSVNETCERISQYDAWCRQQKKWYCPRSPSGNNWECYYKYDDDNTDPLCKSTLEACESLLVYCLDKDTNLCVKKPKPCDWGVRQFTTFEDCMLNRYCDDGDAWGGDFVCETRLFGKDVVHQCQNAGWVSYTTCDIACADHEYHEKASECCEEVGQKCGEFAGTVDTCPSDSYKLRRCSRDNKGHEQCGVYTNNVGRTLYCWGNYTVCPIDEPCEEGGCGGSESNWCLNPETNYCRETYSSCNHGEDQFSSEEECILNRYCDDGDAKSGQYACTNTLAGPKVLKCQAGSWVDTGIKCEDKCEDHYVHDTIDECCSEVGRKCSDVPNTNDVCKWYRARECSDDEKGFYQCLNYNNNIGGNIYCWGNYTVCAGDETCNGGACGKEDECTDVGEYGVCYWNSIINFSGNLGNKHCDSTSRYILQCELRGLALKGCFEVREDCGQVGLCVNPKDKAPYCKDIPPSTTTTTLVPKPCAELGGQWKPSCLANETDITGSASDRDQYPDKKCCQPPKSDKCSSDADCMGLIQTCKNGKCVFNNVIIYGVLFIFMMMGFKMLGSNK